MVVLGMPYACLGGIHCAWAVEGAIYSSSTQPQAERAKCWLRESFSCVASGDIGHQQCLGRFSFFAMDARNKQIPRPKYWQEFEDLCLALFKAVWKDPLAQKNGRIGQPQQGVDVWGAVDSVRVRFQGVQCKSKDESLGSKVTKSELVEEIAKAENFAPPLEHWVLATTAPSDAELQKLAREISVERERQGKFTVQVLGWSDIETLLCDYPNVLNTIYPELGVDLAAIARGLSHIGATSKAIPQAPAATRGQTSSTSIWRHVSFYHTRDIGPALLGRPLSASDALACPRLPEANLAVRQLETAFSVRLAGESGSGKSVCAFQVAHTFAARGWKVFTSSGSDRLPDTVPESGSHGILLVVDDAHIAPEAELRSLEDRAAYKCLVLSTHNSVDGLTSQRGAIRMDTQAGIQAIAAGLLADRQATLEAVRRADNHIGDLMMDDALEERIDHATRYAAVPWQFCFVLGGGWRRANEAASAARALDAELPLAAIAIRQLASRDARSKEADIAALINTAGVDTSGLEDCLRGLAGERLVVSADDLRCPHQRLAAVLLGCILRRQTESGTSSIAAMLRVTLADETLPLGGFSVLLHELAFADHGRWRRLIDSAALHPVIARCWNASEPNEVAAACHVLNEAISYIDDWEANIFRGNEPTFIAWIENAVTPMGHGLACVLNTLLNRQEHLALALTRQTAPTGIAKLISNVDASSAWHVAELTKSLRLGAGDAWAESVIRSLNREPLLALASSWPENEPIYQIIDLFQALVWPAEDLTLDMVEAFIPTARKRLIADPVVQFRYLDDLAWHVLRVLDPLGVYKGKHGASARQLRIARALFDDVDLRELAHKLSQAPLRMFQQVSFILAFLKRVSRPKFNRLVNLMSWDVIGITIGEHWKRLPHDAEVLFGVASGASKSCEPVASLIRRNTNCMEVMAPRLVLIAPDNALDFVRGGKKVALANFSHVDWVFGPFVVRLFADRDVNLLPATLEQCIPTLATSLSEAHESWYKESAPMLESMLKHAPQSLQKALDLMDVVRASVGWTAAWRAGGGSRNAARLLIRSARERTDALGDFARQLGKRARTKTRDG